MTTTTLKTAGISPTCKIVSDNATLVMQVSRENRQCINLHYVEHNDRGQTTLRIAKHRTIRMTYDIDGIMTQKLVILNGRLVKHKVYSLVVLGDVVIYTKTDRIKQHTTVINYQAHYGHILSSRRTSNITAAVTKKEFWYENVKIGKNGAYTVTTSGLTINGNNKPEEITQFNFGN